MDSMAKNKMRERVSELRSYLNTLGSRDIQKELLTCIAEDLYYLLAMVDQLETRERTHLGLINSYSQVSHEASNNRENQ